MQYNTWCGAKTARLFFETMYPWFISERPDVMHLMLVDHEHFWERDAALHKHMNVFLCKTAVCQEYLQKHVVKLGYRGKVWLMAHTSSDPSVDSRNRTSGQVRRGAFAGCTAQHSVHTLLQAPPGFWGHVRVLDWLVTVC